jgi:hypothetical protein
MPVTNLVLHYVIPKGLNRLVQVVMLLTCVLTMPDSNLNWDTDYFDRGFFGSSQSTNLLKTKFLHNFV